MSGFDETRWADKDFSKDFRDSADDFILERATLIKTAVSYFKYFIRDATAKRVLDLGCGDGIITGEIIKSAPDVEAVLVDASADMLKAAGERLEGHGNVELIKSSLEGLFRDDKLSGGFDFAVSSLAIHHLTMEDKAALFDYIYGLIRPGGAFVIIDVVLGPTDLIDDWYLDDWCEWLRERGFPVDADDGEDTFVRPKRCKDIPGNKPDTLADQMEALRSSGFTEVDCFYKIGTFTVFGGKKKE